MNKNSERLKIYLMNNTNTMRKHPSETRGYPYLSSMSKDEFDTFMGLLHDFGVRGLLTAVHEISDFILYDRQNPSPGEKSRAERISRELGAFITRMDGFEELERVK